MPLFVKIVRLTKDIFPLLLRVERRHQTGSLGIFLCCRFVGELQIIDARVETQKSRFIAARVVPLRPRRFAAMSKGSSRTLEITFVDKVLRLLRDRCQSWRPLLEALDFRAELDQFVRCRVEALGNVLVLYARLAQLGENGPEGRGLDTFFAGKLG
jgi:hypothetical protein